MMAWGTDWIADQLSGHAGVLIKITRETETIQLWTSIGQTEFAVTEGDGLTLEHSDRDFLVRADQYVFLGEAVTPRRGDVIEEPNGPNNETSTYHVMAPGGMQPYRLDPTGNLLRIHTKRVAIA